MNDEQQNFTRNIGNGVPNIVIYDTIKFFLTLQSTFW